MYPPEPLISIIYYNTFWNMHARAHTQRTTAIIHGSSISQWHPHVTVFSKCFLQDCWLLPSGRLVWGHTGFHQEGSTFQKREPPLSISNFSHPCMDTWKCVSDKLGLKQLMSTGGISLAAISASEVIDPLCRWVLKVRWVNKTMRLFTNKHTRAQTLILNCPCWPV